MIETSLPAGLERRREDYKLITGTSHYVDDLRPPQRRPAALHMAVVRSPYAHAEIKGIQLDAARTLPGIAAFAGAELVSGMRTIDTIPAPGLKKPEYEEVMYDQDGQLLTGSLMDYTMPNAEQVPNFVTGLVETPSPINPLGAKGVGEAGCIGAPPAIVNAVLDALAPLGIKTIDMPLKPEKVWALVQAARHGTLEQSDPTPPPVFSADEKEQGDEVPDFA